LLSNKQDFEILQMMKTQFFGLCLLVTLPLSVWCQKRSTSNYGVTQQLMQLERDWNTATMKQDKVWLDHFFADELITTPPTSGTIKNKKQEIADTIDPSQKPDSVSLGEMKVILAGQTAVVTGSAYEEGGAQHLHDRKRGYLFTDTFIWRSGRWQLLASHSSRLPQQE